MAISGLAMAGYVLIDVSEVFGIIGPEEFFYDQVPDGLRRVRLAMSLSVLGIRSNGNDMLMLMID
ncbi:hypothetical protein E2562_038878 [Oryza meyeriana var. granulata]|uniref:Uncharacterized protein n=1 Tax=Oryza meyeriana var. granulata TaxID=110450 RepID=A0A6G1CKU4_9ORYZ|nr:hypothetical protein E2562_038878 [Oryza meyeriana var. granulata]